MGRVCLSIAWAMRIAWQSIPTFGIPKSIDLAISKQEDGRPACVGVAERRREIGRDQTQSPKLPFDGKPFSVPKHAVLNASRVAGPLEIYWVRSIEFKQVVMMRNRGSDRAVVSELSRFF